MSSAIKALMPARNGAGGSGARGRAARFRRARRAAAGFTLIELMITVLIVGIIAAVAIPSYRNSVIKGNRRAAQAAMMDIGQREQQYLLDARSYNAFTYTGCTGTNALSYTPPPEACQNYSIVVTTSSPPPAFVITATPVAGSMQVSDGALTLQSDGTKTPSDKW